MSKSSNTFAKVITRTADELYNDCELEIARQREIQNVNRKARNSLYLNSSKQIRKMEVLESILSSVPADLSITVEGCWGDDARGWTLGNAGSIVECVVKYHYNRTEGGHVSKTFGDERDFKMGAVNAEVKASIAPNALATPSEAEFTILVNTLGVWFIKKADALSYVNNKGRLPANRECGKRINWLSERLGLGEWA